FVLVLVLVRDKKAVQPLLFQPGANERQMLGPEGRIGGFVEGLAHGHDLGPLRLWLKADAGAASSLWWAAWTRDCPFSHSSSTDDRQRPSSRGRSVQPGPRPRSRS